MNEMMNMLIRAELTPNQYYMLWAMNENIQPPLINIDLELRRLKAKEYVIGKCELSPKALDLIREVDGHFKKKKKKTDTLVMGENFEDNMEKYNKLFPKKRLKSGKYARSSMSNVKPGLRWFFDNNNFSWDVIFEATTAYVDYQDINGDDYMTCSQYFIRKQQLDKSWISLLSDWCQAIEDGVEGPKENPFKEKTF